MCLEYGCVCNSEASRILLVGVVMCFQAVGCGEAKPLHCCMMLRNTRAMSNSANIDLPLF